MVISLSLQNCFLISQLGTHSPLNYLPISHAYYKCKIFHLQNISDREKREKLEGEKFSQAQTALAKIYNVLKDEEVKRGNSKILTERTCDHDHLYTTGDLLAQVLSNILKEDGERISDMKLKNLEVNLN